MAQGGVARAIGRTAKRAAGVLLLFGAGSGIAAKWRVWKDYVTLPDAFVLELDLEQHSLVERETASPATLLAGGPAQLELGALLHALRSAKEDHRVRGLFAVLGDRANFAGLAQLQELRNAFLDFRVGKRGIRTTYLMPLQAIGGGSLTLGWFIAHLTPPCTASLQHRAVPLCTHMLMHLGRAVQMEQACTT